MRPLEGMRVVDFTLAASGPCTTKLMADWGAEVIKVEAPGGEMMRFRPYELFEWNNLNKRNLVCNAKSPEGLEIIYKLVENADFFVTNFREKALKKLKLDYESLKKINPRIIYGLVSGYGTEGPLADAPGYDVTAFWARTGLLYEAVDKGSAPLVSPLGIGDYAIAPALLSGMLAAWVQLSKTGEGQRVDTSLYAMGLFVNQWYLCRPQADPSFRYPVSRREVKEPMSNCYQTKDGTWFQITLFDFERFFPVLLRICGREELFGTPGFSSFQDISNHCSDVIKVLDEGFAQYETSELFEKFTEAQIAFNKINLPGDALEDEQAWANRYLFNYEFRDGKTIAMPATPVKFHRNEMPLAGFAPRLGEDTIKILTELNYSDTQIQEMLEQGIVQAFHEKGEMESW